MGAGIGNHTETHPIMAHLTASQQTSQLLAQREQLARYGARFLACTGRLTDRSTGLRSRSCIGCTC